MTPDQRARKLLLSHLSPKQRQTFETRGWFEVKGGRTGKTYRIHGDGPIGPAWHVGRNVTLMRRGRYAVSYNAHPAGLAYVEGDKMLAQKLALEDRNRERQFIRKACYTEHSGRSHFWPWRAMSIFFAGMVIVQAISLGLQLWRLWHP